jgi:N-acetylated-alpha-linked acidic dipeptidase
MTRLWGVMALRLANADIVPLDYRLSANRIREFVQETLEAARPDDRPALRPLDAAADRFAAAAEAAGRRMEMLLGDNADPGAMAALSRTLMSTERAFLDADGIPGRPWYRHLIYAPRPTYAPEVLPGVAEALDTGDRAQLGVQVAHLVAALDRAAAVLNGDGRGTRE